MRRESVMKRAVRNVVEAANRTPFPPATLDLHHQRIRAMVDAGQTDEDIDAAFLMVWQNLTQRAQLDDYRAAYRAVVSPAAAPKVSRDPNAGPIATPDEAVAAFAEHGSDRKAAAALGISRTHLRRLLGKDD